MHCFTCCALIDRFLHDFCSSKESKGTDVCSLGLCSSWLRTWRLLPDLQIRCACAITCTAMSSTHFFLGIHALKKLCQAAKSAFQDTYYSSSMVSLCVDASHFTVFHMTSWEWMPGRRCPGLLCHCRHWKAARRNGRGVSCFLGSSFGMAKWAGIFQPRLIGSKKGIMIILRSYIGSIICRYKDPYQPTLYNILSCVCELITAQIFGEWFVGTSRGRDFRVWQGWSNNSHTIHVWYIFLHLP